MNPYEQEPTITLNLKKFLEEVLLSSRAKEFVNPELGELVQETLKKTKNPRDYCHIQTKTHEGEPIKDSYGRLVTVIWHPRDWESDILRWEEQKLNSEIRNKRYEIQKDIRARLEAAIRKDLGFQEGDKMGDSMVKSLALRIFQTKNPMMAKHYGVEIPPDEFDELITLATKEPREETND